MSDNPAVPLAQASAIAEELVGILRPGCTRIEIAGSIRRKKNLVHDVELVAIPQMAAMPDLFGNPGATYSVLEGLLAAQDWRFTKNGPLFKQFEFGGLTVDLFLATEDKWGVIYTLRTGSADFSHWLVTTRPTGAMPIGMRCQDGRLWAGGVPIDTPEEEEVFRALGLTWIEPELRSGPDAYRAAMRRPPQ